jgi:TPP-dependent pyruvate/acetoin dehydrogenase alpha subunit
MHGHSDADDSWYVPKQHLEEWRRRDPIASYENELRDAGLLDDKTIAETETRIKDELESELQFALDSPFPRPESALEGVYAPDHA